MRKKETKISISSASESEARVLIDFLATRKMFEKTSLEVRLRSIPNLSVKAGERNKILEQFGVDEESIKGFKKEMKALSGKMVKIHSMDDPRWIIINYIDTLFPVSIKDIDMRCSIKV